MTALHLERKMVPAELIGAYAGNKFKVEVCEQTTIPADAGLWSGGSRETYTVVEMVTGRVVNAVNHNVAPWDNSRQAIPVKLEPGIAVVRHSMFCGSDMGLTIYVHPDNARKLLPPPVELSALDRMVLEATRNLKSSYMGRDRYEMTRENARYSANFARFPSRSQWEETKQSLMARGFLNKAGAITVSGRNAIA